MGYKIISGRFEKGRFEQQAGYIQLFGQENIQYKFDLYFHWYNLIHETGHCVVAGKQAKMSNVEEEMFVNEFAVGFYNYVGETEKIEELKNIIQSAVNGMPSPVPEGEAFIGFYKDLMETEEGNNRIMEMMKENPAQAAMIYGYFQLSSVLCALEKNRDFCDVLSEIGISIKNDLNFEKCSKDISADNAEEFLKTALNNMRIMGIDVPHIELQLVDNPMVQCASNEEDDDITENKEEPLKEDVYAGVCFKDKLEGGKIVVTGVASFSDKMDCKKAIISGVGKGGNVNADTLEVYGVLKCDNIVAKEMNLAGCISCKDTIKCDKILVSGKWDAKEVTADSIKVINQSHISINVLNCRELITENNMIRKKNAVLKVNEMICKDVHVENVTCNYLYGENVTIGDNCNIKVLEYSDSLTNNGKSKIGKVNKVEKK